VVIYGHRKVPLSASFGVRLRDDNQWMEVSREIQRRNPQKKSNTNRKLGDV